MRAQYAALLTKKYASLASPHKEIPFKQYFLWRKIFPDILRKVQAGDNKLFYQGSLTAETEETLIELGYGIFVRGNTTIIDWSHQK